jgi:hypothetical protein
MTEPDGNGVEAPVAVLAGHLVIYPDAVAFRPDGGGPDTVVVHKVGQVFRETLLHVLATKDLGQMAAFLQMDSMNPMAMLNRDTRRAVKARAKRDGVVIPDA